VTQVEQGLGLLDIAPSYEDVPVADHMLRVYGITSEDVIALFQRFPESRNWFGGGKIDIKALAATAPDGIKAVIAAACRECGNPKAEERAGQFSVEEQLDILEAIGRLTFRSGFGPFVSRLAALARLAVSENSGKAPATISPPASNNSSDADTTLQPSGN
jgi:hypothetical protein